MCDCAEELERQRRIAAAGGLPAAASGGSSFWIPILGGSFVFFGLLGFLYRFYDLGNLWQQKMDLLWKNVVNVACNAEAMSRNQSPCGTERIHGTRRKHPLPDQPIKIMIPGINVCEDEDFDPEGTFKA